MAASPFSTLDQLEIAIVGSGVVGMATGAGLAAKGHAVTFCDVSARRLRKLRAEGLRAVDPAGLVERGADVYLLSVPSPTVDGRVDLTYVRAAASTIGAAIGRHDRWSLVAVRSTVPPGTTKSVVAPLVARTSGRRPRRDFGVCMNPEFLREASALDDFMHPRVIVAGADDAPSARALRAVYAPWADVPVMEMSTRAAETAKYTSNLFNAAKISFFNEMELACLELDVDARAVFEAVGLGCEGMWNPRYGTRGLSPYGGACLPKDTEGFLGFAEEARLDASMLMLRATIETNAQLVRRQAPVELAQWREPEDELPKAQAL